MVSIKNDSFMAVERVKKGQGRAVLAMKMISLQSLDSVL